MHQRGYGSRPVDEALKAFERRGWLLAVGSTIVLSDAALQFRSEKQPKRMQPAPKRTLTRMPRGLFSL
jgi:hypothetical protein